MEDSVCFLDQYPLDYHYHVCKQYLKDDLDWNEFYAEIRENGAAFFEITEIISFFPHLELDENYSLICYLASEFHGVWGRVAAIKNGDSRAPIFDAETEKWDYLFRGKDFKLPHGAVPPMEAIYHDGTNEGYFEAVLCSLFLRGLPYTHFLYNHWDIIMNEPPSNIQKGWGAFVDVPCWIPRRVENTIIAFKREIENGYDSSDGRDRIYLTQFHFVENLGHYHFVESQKRHSMYPNRIKDDKRYNEKRHCCVFFESTVLVAREKEEGTPYISTGSKAWWKRRG